MTHRQEHSDAGRRPVGQGSPVAVIMNIPEQDSLGRVLATTLADAGRSVVSYDSGPDIGNSREPSFLLTQRTASGDEDSQGTSDLVSFEGPYPGAGEYVGCIVNNLDSLRFASFPRLLGVSRDDWAALSDRLVRSTFQLLRAAGRRLVDQNAGGAIVSVVPAPPPRGAGSLSVCVAAIHRLSACVAVELAPHGIRVNCVYVEREQPENGTEWIDQQAGNMVAYLCGDEAAWVTGQAITVGAGSAGSVRAN